MFANEIYQLTYQALILILLLSGPPIIISTVLGLMVAIFQAATQIQEQTLSFTVKLFAVVFTLSAIHPHHPQDWLLENALVVVGIAALLAMRRRKRSRP